MQDPTQRLTFQRLGVLDPMEGSITAEMRDNYRRAFERREMMGVIATNIWSTGVSFDGLEVLGRCAGGQSATVSTQGPGRVCRIETDLGKEGGIVLDCMDHFDRKMLANSMSRRRDYGKHQWTQIMSDGSIWKSRAWRPKGGSTNT